jgi:predicted DsbA family dithiol-disulfide isomerase
MEIEIWSDVVCPWCYIGKRRFEKALERFPHRDAVTIHWRSFELDPHAAQQFPGTLNDMLAQKYDITPEEAGVMNARVSGLAAAEGLDYHLGSAQPGNTFDAHRLLHLAAKRGVQGAMTERLLRAYFTESRPIGDTETLAQLAVEAGLDADEARATLASDDYADEVRADEERATLLGIRGVPFLVADARYGVSGAQPTEVFLQALQTAWSAAQPLTMVAAQQDDADDTGACVDDSCAI